MKCFRCGSINELENEYCSGCGEFLGINFDDSEIEMAPVITKAKFLDIFKLPKFMWLDELMHTYTEWHLKYKIDENHCRWVQLKLERDYNKYVELH